MQSYKDKIKKQKTINHDNQSDNLRLNQQNLVPVYLIEDNMKNNFTLIQKAINQHSRQFKRNNQKFIQTNLSIQKLDQKINNKIQQTQNSIETGIKRDLQGIVTMIINRHLKVVLQKFQDKQQQDHQKQSILNNKLKAIQQKLSFQIAQENQKYFIKQVTKIQKQIDKKIMNNTTKNNNSKQVYNKKMKQQNFMAQKVNKNMQQDKNLINFSIDNIQQRFSQINQKIQQIQNFNCLLDKKFSDQFQSLRGNWKQVGSQLLDNKKILCKKIDNLNADVILLKTGSEFKKMPLDMQQSFKKQIIQKFAQTYRVISTMASHSQFQTTNQRNKKILNRYNQQLIDLRRQQFKNNQFFTVYMNNSKSQDLIQQFHKIRTDIIKDKQYLQAIFDSLRNKDQVNTKMIEQIGKNIGAIEIEKQNIQKKVFTINLHTENLIQKVKVLQDLNDIGPQKMRKIHDTLNKGFNSYSFQYQQGSPQKFRNKQIYAQINKLKDQLFLLSSQHNIKGIQKQDVIGQLKNQVKKIHQKIQKIKYQGQQGAISRKPWVCLSCDKQKMNQKIKDTFKNSASKKKVSLQIGKSGGFLTNRSQKNITFKLSNSPHIQEKFEIYEKFRQKYLTDTLKLPQLYKQKIGSLQNELM